jgi:hypothetical protein
LFTDLSGCGRRDEKRRSREEGGVTMRQARIAAALALLSACFARDSQVGGTTSDTSAEEGCTRTIGYWKNHAGGRGNNPDVVTR